MRSKLPNHSVRILLAIALGSLSVTLPTAGQSTVNPQAPVIRQGPLAPKVPPLEQATFEVICQGGSELRVESLGGTRHALYFQQSRQLPDNYGTGLLPGRCSPVDRLFTTLEPPAIQFVDAAGEQSITAHWADPSRYWRFVVVKTNYGYFEARSYQRVLVVSERAPGAETAKKLEAAKEPEAAKKAGEAPPKDAELKPADKVVPNPAEKAGINPQPLPPKDGALKPVDNLFEMDDRAIIIVGGKKTTAGDAKREIVAELRRATGPPQTFSVAARKTPAQLPTTNTPLVDAPGPSALATQPIQGQASGRIAADLKMDCTRNLPRISNVQGRIAPGVQFTIIGTCFGNGWGYVEILGQFEGGKLKFSRYRVWKDDAIVVEMPYLEGIVDHTIAISVWRADDGKQSAAKQGRFVATRERVEVPGRYWEPGPHFTWTDVQEAERTLTHQERLGDRLNWAVNDFRLKVNPACALETMEIPTSVGYIQSVTGWENPPPHEANVRVLWSPQCTYRRTLYGLGVAEKRQRICRVAFELKAWASCPLGIAP